MFVSMMFVVSMAIAGCAAFFSVKGIGLLFAGSFISVVIMASCLEAGKLVAASFLYRAWDRLSWWMRVYLVSATVLLMGITSLGIFGFLSDAYEQTKTKVEILDSTIVKLNDENQVIQQQIDTYKESGDVTKQQNDKSIQSYKTIYDNFVSQQQTRIDQLNNRLQALDEQLSQLQSEPGGLFSNKDKKIEQLKQQQAAERSSINTQLAEIDLAIADQYKQFLTKIDQLNNAIESIDMSVKTEPLYQKLKQNEQQIIDAKIKISETDIGSFRFIARAFDIDTDTAVKWFTLIIVIVFDPLAVTLIVGYNVLLMRDSRASRDHHSDEKPKGPVESLVGMMKSKHIPRHDKLDDELLRPRHRPEN